LPGDGESWRLPGDAINLTAGVSPDGKSVAFFGTYEPPGSGMLNTTENRSKWVTGLMYSSRGTGVNAVFTTPTPAFPREYLEFPGSISWSPDGRAFAYDYHGKIYIFDIPGKASRLIASGSSPDWSSDGHWIAFRSAEGMAYAVDPVTLRGRDLFGNRRILAGVHWSPDSRYVVLSEKFGFASNLLHFRNPFLMGVMLIVRVEDGDSVPIGWIGPESRDDRGFDWVSDYRAFLQRAAVKPIVPGCE
jgi:Tol biopolymer transport system component